MEHQRPNVSVDVIPLTIHEGRLSVLLTERQSDPFKGQFALAGGYIHTDEDGSAGAAARRVLRDKLGISQLYVEQLSTFSGPTRDPRGWSLSVAYFSLSPVDRLLPALDSDSAKLVAIDDVQGLPFDHDLIVSAAVSRIRGKGAYSDLPARLLGPDFSLRELHQAYAIAIGEDINIDAFRRKIIERGFLEETGEQRMDSIARRPATIYRLKPGYAVFNRRF